MTTRAEAITAAAACLAPAYAAMYGLDGTSVEDAARAAYTPGGPSIAELEDRIRTARAALHTERPAA